MGNKELFRECLLRAIGGMSQAEFAKKADISRYGLCRFLNGNNEHVPTERTLRKIANASEGRVGLEELLYASGRSEGVIAKARDIIRILSAFARLPVRWEKPTFAEEKIKARHPGASFSFVSPQSIDRNSTLTGNAEKAVGCEVTWTEGEEVYHLGVVLYYCCTTGGGYIPFGCESRPDLIRSLGFFREAKTADDTVMLWSEPVKH